jgi:predicted nucleic acid-binding protein
MYKADVRVAAIAERYQLTVLHYDGDYDRIAALTCQPAEWSFHAAPRTKSAAT